MLLWGGGRQGWGHPQKLTGQLSQVSTVENRKRPRPKQRRGKGPTPLSSTPCFVYVCFHVQTWILHTCTPASNQTENNNNSSTLSCWQRGKMWRPFKLRWVSSPRVSYSHPCVSHGMGATVRGMLGLYESGKSQDCAGFVQALGYLPHSHFPELVALILSWKLNDWNIF